MNRTSPSGVISQLFGQVSLDHGSIAAQSTLAATVALPGAKVNDVPAVSPTAAIQAGIGVAWTRISAADTLQIGLVNYTTGAIDPASITFDVSLSRRTPG